MDSKWLKPAPKVRTVRKRGGDDTAIRNLSREERRSISMDSWEPSLLRHLLSAQDRLKKP